MPPHRLFPPPCPDKNIRHIIHHYIRNAVLALYEAYFIDIHNTPRKYLEAAGGKKQLEKLVLPAGQNVFTYRKAAMSLGDVHMILMAFFTRMPIILTEDADIDKLRAIAKRKMKSEAYALDIYITVDILIMLAEKEDSVFKGIFRHPLWSRF